MRGSGPAAHALAAVAAGGLLLLWPAFLNGYPLVFSDTGAFLAQTGGGWLAWDKPVVYGPLLHAFHWRVSLWFPAVAQAVLLSWLLWLTLRMVRGAARPGAHLLVVAALCAGTAAPWVAALLMPDALAPALVLAVAVLGWGGPRPSERAGLLLVAVVAAAAHLAHLPLLGALLLVLAAARRWRAFFDGAAALCAALLVLLATNAVFQGRAAVSPYGAVFALARLVADGPAARTVEARCPESGWHLCRWAGRLPKDADEFLWAPDGPGRVARPDGVALLHPATGLAPEAEAILRETWAREPWGVLRAAAVNTVRQLLSARVGDTLGPDHLGATVGWQLDRVFPPAERRRFAESLQSRGSLPAAAAPLLLPHLPVLLLGVLALPLAVRRAWRDRDARFAGFLLCVGAGVLANAAVLGALSGPHDRYGARMAWLLPLAAFLAWRPGALAAARPGDPGETRAAPARAAGEAAGAAAP